MPKPWPVILAAAILLGPVRAAHPEDHRSVLMSLYRINQAGFTGLALLRDQLARHKGTAIEDDIMLFIASAEASRGNTAEAIKLLETLARQPGDTKVVDMLWLAGHATDDEILAQAYLNASPDFTSDHALLNLASLHAKLDPEKLWDALERLRAKYPRGDRAEQDADFFGPWLGKLRFPQGDGVVNDTLLNCRRPHFTGLRWQADICLKNEKEPEVAVSIMRQLIEIYGELMTAAELKRYAVPGLDLAKKLADQGTDAQKHEADEAIGIFEAALKDLKTQDRSIPEH